MMSMWTRVAALCFSHLAVICQDSVATSPPEFQHHYVFSSMADLKEKLEHDPELQDFFVKNLHPGEHATVITTIGAGCPETTTTVPTSTTQTPAFGVSRGDDAQSTKLLKLPSTTTEISITSDETTTHVHVPNTTKITTTSVVPVPATEIAATTDETPTTHVHDPETTKIVTTSGVSATTPVSTHPPETTPQATTDVATTVESTTCEAPDGWNCWPYGDRNLIYKFFYERKDYMNASEKCGEDDGRLAAAIIRDFTKEEREKCLHKDVAYWIGLQDMGKEKDFVWADAGEYNKSKTSWGTKQPDNFNHSYKKDDEDCVHVRLEDGMLNDALCSDKHMFVCERKIDN